MHWVNLLKAYLVVCSIFHLCSKLSKNEKLVVLKQYKKLENMTPKTEIEIFCFRKKRKQLKREVIFKQNWEKLK